MAETGVGLTSLVGVKGAISFVPGAAGSFLPNKPNIEFLLVGFGGFSRTGVVGVCSAAFDSVVSSETIGLSSSAEAAVVPSTGMTGAAMTRDAVETC